MGLSQGCLCLWGILRELLLVEVVSQVVRDGKRQGKPAINGSRKQGVSTQAVRTVVGPGALTGGKEAVDGGHLIEIGPQATHGEVASRSDAHRSLVGGLANGLFVHLDEVGVALADLVLTQALDGVAEVQVHRVVQRANAQASVNLLGDGTGSNVTRNQVAECRVAALQEVVALFFRNGIRVAVVALLLRGPNAAVVTQGLRHQDGLGLPIGVDR